MTGIELVYDVLFGESWDLDLPNGTHDNQELSVIYHHVEMG